MTRKTRTPTETQALTKEIISSLGFRNVICLYGPMGSGKTTLVQGIAKELGITKKIVSPTFILVRQYKLNSKFIIHNSKFTYLWHVDLYRLDDPSQIRVLGIEEIWSDQSNLVVIEWAEK